MKNFKLPPELFTLSKEQEELSVSIYGKVIKCLVAPYHAQPPIDMMSWVSTSSTTFLFPERETSYQQERNFISFITGRDDTREHRVVTTSMSIIGDMVDGCVRVLTERDEIVDCPIKTFAANLHSIRHCLLENDDFARKKKERSNTSYIFIDILLKEILAAQTKGATDAEKENFRERTSLIGEEVIERKLNDMIDCRTP